MTRTSIVPNPSPEVDAINLARVLSRLEHKILSPEADPRLKTSSYERTKTSANVEYARDLLLRLEHVTSTQKIQSRKAAAQSTLIQQRALIKRLNDRLYELNQQDDGSLSSDSEADEDLLGSSWTPSSTSLSSPNVASPTLDRRKELPITSESTIRARHPNPPTSLATTTAHTLFSVDQTTTSPTSMTTSTPSTLTAKTLESATATQEDLTSSLLDLASALKNSSLALSAVLAADEKTLSTTAAALDKNADSMGAATKRMGMLRSMSEGRWWWGRMVLYACIAGLWVVALGIVFVGPKLRF